MGSLGPGAAKPEFVALEAADVTAVGVTPGIFLVFVVLVLCGLIFSGVGETANGAAWPAARALSKPLVGFDIPVGFVRVRKTVAFTILPCVRFEVSPPCDAWV